MFSALAAALMVAISSQKFAYFSWPLQDFVWIKWSIAFVAFENDDTVKKKRPRFADLIKARENHFSFAETRRHREQCDQIGRFLKVLGNKISCKRNLNEWQNFGLFWKTSRFCQHCIGYFLANFWKKIGLLLTPTSDHTGREIRCQRHEWSILVTFTTRSIDDHLASVDYGDRWCCNRWGVHGVGGWFVLKAVGYFFSFWVVVSCHKLIQGKNKRKTFWDIFFLWCIEFYFLLFVASTHLPRYFLLKVFFTFNLYTRVLQYIN